MIQFLYIPIVFIGFLSISGFIAWLSKERPNSLINRFAKWSLSFVEALMGRVGAEEFAALHAGTQIVDCTPTQKRLQPGAVSSNSAGPSLNPELPFLVDGRCAYDPSAIAKPFREDSVDGTSTEAIWEWTPITAVALSSLPTGIQIVNCWDKIKELPSGVLLLVGKNFSTEHPGFYFLTEGR